MCRAARNTHMRLSMRTESLKVVGIQLRDYVVATHGEGMDMIQFKNQRVGQ